MLDQSVGVVCRELAAAYDRNAREFDPSVGDNAYTFATNVLHHSRYGVAQQLGDRVEIEVLESGLAWRLQVGETTLRVYKMGRVAPSDIRRHRLDPCSEVKRQMGEDNAADMQQVLDLAQSGVAAADGRAAGGRLRAERARDRALRHREGPGGAVLGRAAGT